MTDFYQRFVIDDIPALYRLFIDVIAEARAFAQPRTAQQLEFAFVDMQRELESLSLKTAQIADLEIKERIHATAKRAAQTEPGGLLDHISSEPIIADAGIVGVARMDGAGGLRELPYWKVQEEGSEEAYPEFMGRVIRGFFHDAGGSNPEVPTAGINTQPYFLPDRAGGFGTIQHEIDARYFLRDGTEKAARYWTAQQQRIKDRAVKRIRAAMLGTPGRR